MKKERWVEILVVVVFAGGLAFLARNDMDVSHSLGRIDADVRNTSQRLDRITEALPDVRIRIAHEEVNRKIQAAVVIGSVRFSQGGWRVDARVVDTKNGLEWILPVSLSSKEDRAPIYSLVGLAADIDPEFSSFARLDDYATRAKIDLPKYENYDPATSFVLRNVNAADFLERGSFVGKSQGPTKTTFRASTYLDMAKHLNQLLEGQIQMQQMPPEVSPSPQ